MFKIRLIEWKIGGNPFLDWITGEKSIIRKFARNFEDIELCKVLRANPGQTTGVKPLLWTLVQGDLQELIKRV